MADDGVGESGTDTLNSKMEELQKLREKLNLAKDDAIQSGLASQPLVDELEQLQAEVACVKALLLKAKTSISELQSHLGTTDMCIKSKKEEEVKIQAQINDKNRDLDETQEEMEELTAKIDEAHRDRSKMKQALRLKRRILRSLELSYEAVVLETETFRTSAAEALNYMSNSEKAFNVMVQLTQEESYGRLEIKARENISAAERRISVSMDEKLEAVESRDSALRRLAVNSRKGPRKRSTQEDRIGTPVLEEPHEFNSVTDKINSRQFGFPEAKEKVYKGATQSDLQEQGKTENQSDLIQKKKSSSASKQLVFLVLT